MLIVRADMSAITRQDLERECELLWVELLLPQSGSINECWESFMSHKRMHWLSGEMLQLVHKKRRA